MRRLRFGRSPEAKLTANDGFRDSYFGTDVARMDRNEVKGSCGGFSWTCDGLSTVTVSGEHLWRYNPHRGESR